MIWLLVDTNVLIDIFTCDPRWYEWSLRTLRACMRRGLVVINPVIYAELSPSFDLVGDLDAHLPPDDFERHHLPWAAAFLAGPGLQQRGGKGRARQCDFYIGAHATVMGFMLVTRDASRYRSYFPRLDIIAP